MSEEVGIVMSLYDKVSPTLKAISGNTKAFDKSLDELEQSLKAYEKAQDSMVKQSADLKKAMAEADQKVKDARKSYRQLKDETSKGALDAAIDEQERLRQRLSDTEAAIKANRSAYQDLYKSAQDAARGMSKLDNRAAQTNSGREGDALLNGLAAAGIGSLWSDAVSQLGNSYLSSAMGESQARRISGILSGAISGGTMGSVFGPQGIAIGAAAGGLAGLVSGQSEAFATEDEAFKSYYSGLVEAGASAREASLSAGSDTAAQRELDAIAFNRLLGEGVGDQYLSDLRTMAAATPMEYSDLTDMSRALATGFGDSPQRMLELMEAIGDAGSAVGVTASDMTEMARAMSRMNSSGKATLEYLNIFQDRGVDAIGMLSEALGKTQGEIYDMISKGEINGKKAANILQQGMVEAYSGAMEQMSTTFSGLSSTLADAQTELNNAYGEGYNSTRSGGLEAEISAYGGLLGQAVENLNRISGENAAYLENLSERYTREALSAVLLGEDTTLFGGEQQAELERMRDEFIDASAAYEDGSQEAGLKMDSLRTQAEALATAAYESSDQYQMLHETELDQIEAIRENTVALGGWRNELEKQQELSKGQGGSVASGIFGMLEQQGAQKTGLSGSGATYTVGDAMSFGKSLLTHLEQAGSSHTGFAYGLDRVPYDNYAAILHQGERVLTAREARAMDRQGGAFGPVTVTGNQFVIRQESDIDAVAAAILRRAELAAQGGVR